jgi:hypothetical protein
MSAKFAVTVKFPFTNKSYRIPMNPRAETDAARVEW